MATVKDYLMTRYYVYALHGDSKRLLVTGCRDDAAQAVEQAIIWDQLGIYGRTIVQDRETGDVIAAFQSGKPLDPSKL
jgi:hypothetical protein